jgi:F0F1-type ATP synthase epsilon subunit
MSKGNQRIILEIIKNESSYKKECKGIFLITDNHEYSIFENHSALLLPIKNAIITIKSNDNNIDEAINIERGIFVFQNNKSIIITL